MNDKEIYWSICFNSLIHATQSNTTSDMELSVAYKSEIVILRLYVICF